MGTTELAAVVGYLMAGILVLVGLAAAIWFCAGILALANEIHRWKKR